MEPITITLDGNLDLTIADDHIDSVVADPYLRRHFVTCGDESPNDLFLKRRLGPRECLALLAQVRFGIAHVRDQLATKVTWLQIPFRIKRMHQPELVLCATRRNIKALLEFVLLAQSKWCARWAVDHAEQDHVTLVSLELSCASCSKAPGFKLDCAERLQSQLLYQAGLLVTK